jgi:transcriptional regulator GlxA family with amidase domain
MDKSAMALWTAQRSKIEVARSLIQGLRAELPEITQRVHRQAAAVDGARPATRFEMVRRATLAQAYLQATTDRSVDLAEVAAAVGVSQFRLLVAFRQCFGETPASYHRKLRLRLVVEEARRRGMPISAVADQFGFAGASNFSHAYRRAFGQAPVWSKSEVA